MEPFNVHTGIVAAMNRANVDTDAIMPKQYLKSIRKYGYGDWLFDDWRYLDAGDVDIDCATRRPNPDFELNQPLCAGASILLAQENFGCGSSREHAVWGLRDFGFKVIIAPSFADIFFNNCFNNGVLAITLPQTVINQIFDLCNDMARTKITVDLENQILSLPTGESTPFDIDKNRRERLLKGLDPIAVTLSNADKIKAFEAQHSVNAPWVFTDL